MDLNPLLSKALERYKIARSIRFPFSKALESSWTNVNSWVSQSASGPESVLAVCQDVFIEMLQYAAADNVFM